MHHNGHDTMVAWYRRPAVLGLLAIGGFFAIYYAVQNWEQTAPYLPWLLIGAIPLMHLFMHRGHGAHGAHGGTGGCGGHGSHGGGHQTEAGAGHKHGDARPPGGADAAKETDSGGQGGCCGGGSHAHESPSDASTQAQGGGCCGSAGAEASDEVDDQPQRGVARR